MEKLRESTRADLVKAFSTLSSTCRALLGNWPQKKYSECDISGAGYLRVSLYRKIFGAPYYNVGSLRMGYTVMTIKDKKKNWRLVLAPALPQAMTLGKNYLNFSSISGIIRITGNV